MSITQDGVPEAVDKAIGARVAWFMRYAGTRHTQAELAGLLGLKQSAISKKLLGHRPFQPHELYAIAEWLDRPISDLLPIKGVDTPPDTWTSSRRPTGDDAVLVAAA